MRSDSLTSALAHHVLHAFAISGAAVAVAAIALGLELFRHLLIGWGASGELAAAVEWLSHILAFLDLAIVGLVAVKAAGRALRRLMEG